MTGNSFPTAANTNGFASSNGFQQNDTLARSASMHLYTGLVSGYQTEMMRAVNDYKTAQQQQIHLKARIIKLQKDEDKCNKRIKDTKRLKEFMADMQDFKR